MVRIPLLASSFPGVPVLLLSGEVGARKESSPYVLVARCEGPVHLLTLHQGWMIFVKILNSVGYKINPPQNEKFRQKIV